MIKKNPYKFTVLSLYINYVLQGMAAIILSQNMRNLVEQMNTTVPRFSLVISAIGLGRILTLYSAGRISDKWSRKLVIVLGMFSYVLFFGGILWSQSLYMGIFFALFAGAANALLDTGTYPTLLEAMPDLFDSVSVLNRAFISIGQFILPIVVSLTIVNDLYFGISFLFCLVILALNLVVMLRYIPFPVMNNDLKVKDKKESYQGTISNFSRYLAGSCLVVYGFTSVSTFNIFVTWIPHVAGQVIGMGPAVSVGLVSLYSAFSFISVILTSILVKKWIKPMYLVLLYTTGACVTLMALAFFPSVMTAYLAAFGVGFFATGGIWQLGLTTLLELFPVNKGRITSYYSFLTSLSVMMIPYITGQLEIGDIMKFNSLVTFIGVVLACITVICVENKTKQVVSY